MIAYKSAGPLITSPNWDLSCLISKPVRNDYFYSFVQLTLLQRSDLINAYPSTHPFFLMPKKIHAKTSKKNEEIDSLNRILPVVES